MRKTARMHLEICLIQLDKAIKLLQVTQVSLRKASSGLKCIRRITVGLDNG